MKNIIIALFLLTIAYSVTTVKCDSDDNFSNSSGTIVYVVNLNEIAGLLIGILLLLVVGIGVGIWLCVMKCRDRRNYTNPFHRPLNEQNEL